MREHGIDEIYIRAMNCHGYGICTDVKPESKMEKTLFTVDELTGLINALCLMRPSKSVLDLELKSVKKKFKDKSFAAGVNRDTIRSGCEMQLPDDDPVYTLKKVMEEIDFSSLLLSIQIRAETGITQL